ncbi:FAD-binding oxidoreductase [Polymorphobacter arshaanensis]|uniref:FAD-binding oxidoreductase n=1 Tax=Glacieibacterium arshaanense TaxID=2511025 RepID=A0A4Y9ERR1_9SPHN|nr:FAD-binding oxidoreductase [Polymorphobacter arshaanensis]TFU05893.1 FAD-binding oxidoreductase [Polymorphobacter arshaanensis]
MSNSPRTAIVIGGGLVGSACALRLAGAGLAVTVIDDAPKQRPASWGNAGHIAVEQVEPIASWATLRSAPRRHFARGGALDLPVAAIGAWLPFGLRLAAAATRFDAGKAALTRLMAGAMPAWRRLAADLGDAALLREDGHFILWETAATAAAGRAAWAATDTGSATIREATATEIEVLRGAMGAAFAGAVRCEGSAQIADQTQLAEALAAALARAGVVRHLGAATLVKRGDRVTVEVGGEGLDADVVLVAAGIGSAALLAGVGVRVPLIAERGYHIEAPTSGAMLPPRVFEDRSMIVTRFGNRLRAASFVEFSRADLPPDPRKWARLQRHVAELGLAFEGEVTPWYGSRPTLPDYLPAIGRVAGTANLAAAFGHNHLGLTLSAVTGEIVAYMLVGEAAPDPAFSTVRF